MAKTWVLDTETKGTGAQVVPLEQALRKRAPEPALSLVSLGSGVSREAPAAPDEAPARSFKVVDLMSGQPLAEHTDVRETLAVLGRVRRSVDVHVYVWQPHAERWRLLNLDEQRALWARRGAPAPA